MPVDVEMMPGPSKPWSRHKAPTEPKSKSSLLSKTKKKLTTPKPRRKNARTESNDSSSESTSGSPVPSMSPNAPVESTTKALNPCPPRVPLPDDEDIYPGEVAFEQLLRPLRDITNNWKFRISKCLDYYLETVRNNTRQFSFAEAALVVGNSTNIYCRRVDLVYKMLVDFSDNLTMILLGQDPGAAAQPGPNGKKRKPVLVREDLVDIGYATTSNSVNCTLDKLRGKMKELKTVILNSSMKAKSKEGTSCIVYHGKGLELGYKNEFRLNWYKSSDGILYEDFNNNSMGVDLGWRNKSRISFAAPDDSVDDIDDDILHNDEIMDAHISDDHMEVEPLVADSSLMDHCQAAVVEDNHLIVVNSPMAPSPRIELEKVKETPPPGRVWPKLPSSEPKMQVILFKKGKEPPLPRVLRSKNNEMNTRKRKRVSVKEEASESCIVYLNMVGKAAIDPPETNNRRSEETKRKKILAERRIANAKVVEIAAKDFEGDFAGFDIEGDDNNNDESFVNDADPKDDSSDACDNEDINTGLVAPLDERMKRAENINKTIRGEEPNVIANYKQSKKDHANLATILAKRVAEWHESLQPVLKKCEQRTKFDIASYGSKILEKFPANEDSPVKPFGYFVNGEPKEEICRYFLSSLMLANTYNVEVIRTNMADLSKDCMQLKLLSRQRHHEDLDDNMRVTSSNANLN